MNKRDSQEPKLCGCKCGCPLNDDPNQVREKEIERVMVVMNISCFESAYGKELDNKNSQAPKVCGCGYCGKPLSTDHLRGVKYVHLENGDPALVNIECSIRFEANIPTKENNHA